MAAIDSAYHYFLSTYGHSAVSRYDTHKKSELRGVYNQMLKINKESPLFKIKTSPDVPKFLIDIKECARHVKNVVASLSDGDSLKNSFQKKVAVTSDESTVSADYIGGYREDSFFLDFDLEVLSLAAPQVNVSNFLNDKSLDFEPANYSFDLTTTANSYEFQYTVKPDDTNYSVLTKLSRLINTSGVGLTAELISDEDHRSALKITSKQTGLSENEHFLFDIKPHTSSQSIQSMNTLGINQVNAPATNSKFLLNGKEHSSYSNTFTVNNMFEVTLHRTSPKGSPVLIGFKTSTDAVADNLQQLVDAYNDFVSTGKMYSNSQIGRRLLKDLKEISNTFRNELESIGMMMDEDDRISIDKNLLSTALETENPQETFSVLNSFKNGLLSKANDASVNPMKYVDKVLISYKRPGNNFSSPYSSSIYAGLMLDHYC